MDLSKYFGKYIYINWIKPYNEENKHGGLFIMGIGEKLKRAREVIGLSQIEVSSKTGINNKTLSNWENDISEPDVENLRILCKLYNISSDEIINIPLDESSARVLYKKYLNSPRNIQEAIEAMLGWKPDQSETSKEGKEKH